MIEIIIAALGIIPRWFLMRRYWREINRGRALMILDGDVHGAIECYVRAGRMAEMLRRGAVRL